MLQETPWFKDLNFKPNLSQFCGNSGVYFTKLGVFKCHKWNQPTSENCGVTQNSQWCLKKVKVTAVQGRQWVTLTPIIWYNEEQWHSVEWAVVTALRGQALADSLRKTMWNKWTQWPSDLALRVMSHSSLTPVWVIRPWWRQYMSFISYLLQTALFSCCSD